MIEPPRLFKEHTERALKRLRGFLKLDVEYFLKSGFWLFCSNMAANLSSLIVVLAFTHLTTKELYGEYQFILAVLTTVSVFALPGMGIAVTQAVARGRYAALIQGTLARMRWSLLGSVALLVTAAYLKFVQPKEFWAVFVLAAAVFPFYLSFNTLPSYYQGRKWFGNAVWVSRLPSICSSLAVFAILWVLPDLFWIFVAFFAVEIGMRYFFYRRETRKKLQGQDKEVVHYGWHLSIIKSMQIVAANIDKLIISYFLGMEQLAVYAVAMALPDTAKAYVNLGAPMLLPKLAEIKKSQYEMLKSKFWIAFVISIGTAIVGILISPFVINLLFSDTYANAGKFAQVLFASLAFVFPAHVFMSMLQAKKQVKSLYKIRLASTVISLCALMVLIPLYGLWGACFSRLIVRYINAAQLWWYARKV